VITDLHHVQLACPAGSEPASRAFYGGLLGMSEVTKPAALAARGGAWFRAGSAESSGAEIHLGVEEDFRPARKAHPGLIVSDLDTLARRLVAAGYGVVADGSFPGYRRIYTADPHGNRLEFLEALAGDRLEDGMRGEVDRDPEQQAGDHRDHHDPTDAHALRTAPPGAAAGPVRYGLRVS
jgi:catechol 2,3-dioxygenase-like lactoylglutathione lyase family enzyme